MKKALFLDRDGVVNIDTGYLYKIEEVQFIDGIFDLCRKASDLDYLIIIVTNQSGIGRGYYSESDFQKLSEWMKTQFANQRAEITNIYHCPYHPEHGIGQYKRNSFDRKPNPGMLLKAAADYHIDLAASFLVGDSETDIKAAYSANIGFPILFNQDTNLQTQAKAYIHSLKMFAYSFPVIE